MSHCLEIPALIVDIKNDADKESYAQKENGKNPREKLARDIGPLGCLGCDTITRSGSKRSLMRLFMPRPNFGIPSIWLTDRNRGCKTAVF